MINFNQSDAHDVKIQLEYLNSKPEYQEDKLQITIYLLNFINLNKINKLIKNILINIIFFLLELLF